MNTVRSGYLSPASSLISPLAPLDLSVWPAATRPDTAVSLWIFSPYLQLINGHFIYWSLNFSLEVMYAICTHQTSNWTVSKLPSEVESSVDLHDTLLCD